MCLQLDYLPLWLAKISITPTMRKEMPGIAEKLVAYQLKAKDVLAAAFLEKKVNNPNVIQLQLPDFNDKIEVLERKVDKIFEDMGAFSFYDGSRESCYDTSSSKESRGSR